MKRILVLLAVVSLLTANSLAHISLIEGNHAKQQTFKVEKVAGNVYVLFGRGGNIGVSYGEDGLMMIDTQFEDIADKIKAELAKLGTDKSRFVFNTHWHGDHTGGNPVFGKDAMIIAHSNVRNRLLTRVGRDGKPNPGACKTDCVTACFTNKELIAPQTQWQIGSSPVSSFESASSISQPQLGLPNRPPSRLIHRSGIFSVFSSLF